MTSQPEVTTFWGRLGSFGDKISSWKKMGSSNAFPVPDGTIGSLLHLSHVLDYVFSIFHFYEVVNCKLQSLWIRSGYINLCTFRHTIKVTDHHGDDGKVVPFELITFDYTHQSLEMSTCLASFDRSTMDALWLECGRRHKHEIDTLSACDPEHRRRHKI